jgi:lysyl-tRNA synthetase, class II
MNDTFLPPDEHSTAFGSSASEGSVRKQNIVALRDAGIDPYPAAGWHPTHSIYQAAMDAEELQRNECIVRLAGRVISQRAIGKVIFIDLYDEGDRIQLYFSRDAVGEDLWWIGQHIDIGDFVGVQGHLFTTRRGERTLHVKGLTILGKALRHVPIGKRGSGGELHQAIADTGRLLRERHLDLLTNPVLRNRLIMRDRLIREVRAYFHGEGFIEIDTPTLGRKYGGAAATPFITNSKALNVDLYLRVSPEGFLKQALCGGINKVFEIGKNFRNEGIDHSHNPEFTAIEWYEAWTDYRDQMSRFETVVSRLARVVSETMVVRFRGRDINFAPPWPRERMVELVCEHIGVEERELSVTLMQNFWKDQQIPGVAPRSWGELVIGVFEECVQQSLIGPTFIIDHPVEGSPLTKKHRADSRLVERFEPYVMGIEIGNAYSELNDPEEQRKRLVEQDMARDEAYGIDDLFLSAMEHGMPQAGGAGIGLDRLIMILTRAERLSDVILFPAT